MSSQVVICTYPSFTLNLFTYFKMLNDSIELSLKFLKHMKPWVYSQNPEVTSINLKSVRFS